MKVQVINVGDGACSVCIGEESLMVADCGEGATGNPVLSAQKLDQAVGADSDRIQTIVVTHFDADHWKGLEAYPTMLLGSGRGGVLPKRVVFRTPRFPQAVGRFPASQLVLEAASATGAGPLSAALDLFGAWRRAGVRVDVHPTARGGSFMGADEIWRAHWPPRDISALPHQSQSAIGRLNNDLDELAEVVPEFAEALDIAYGVGWTNDEVQTEAVRVTSSLTGGQLLAAINRAVPTFYVGKLIRKLRRYNNALSLVYDSINDDGCGRLINFGDCEKVGLNSLLRLQYSGDPLLLATHYECLLAPHHGTQEPNTNCWRYFPRVAGRIVAQNGRKHHGNQKVAFLHSLPLVPPPGPSILNTFGSFTPITFML